MDEHLIIERRESNLWITFNRPDKANAWTPSMMERAAAAIVSAGTEDTIRAVLLTSVGERFFSAGYDVREKPADGDMVRHRERRSAAGASLQDAVLNTPKPVIVVLNGSAIGAGAMIALLADTCIAVDTADLSLPEIDLGIATFSGANILETMGGRALAMDLIQRGRRMPASEALQRGLVGDVVTREGLEGAAIAMADTLGKKNVQTFADNKQWINRAMKAAMAEARTEHARHRAAAVKDLPKTEESAIGRS